MTSSIVLNESAIISQPDPAVTTDHIVVPHSNYTRDESTLEFTIRENEYIQLPNNTNNVSCLLIYKGSELVYHFLDESLHKILNTENQQEFTLLYDKDKNPLWTLVNKDWHGMSLKSNTSNTTILLSNMSPRFKFTLNQQEYYWQLLPSTISLYSLACYSSNSPTQSIAEFKNNQLSILNQHQQSFLCLSAILVNYHVKYLLKSLGNKPEVIQMMLHDNISNPYTIKHQMSTDSPSTRQQHQLEAEEEEDEIASLSSIVVRNYPGHHNLVNNSNDNRWSSSAQSFKSIELDPGFWHCYWGYKFWWSWFPCCMPGGCIDRACIRIRGGHRPKNKPSRTLSKQGYQQQHY